MRGRPRRYASTLVVTITGGTGRVTGATGQCVVSGLSTATATGVASS